MGCILIKVNLKLFLRFAYCVILIRLFTTDQISDSHIALPSFGHCRAMIRCQDTNPDRKSSFTPAVKVNFKVFCAFMNPYLSWLFSCLSLWLYFSFHLVWSKLFIYFLLFLIMMLFKCIFLFFSHCHISPFRILFSMFPPLILCCRISCQLNCRPQGINVTPKWRLLTTIVSLGTANWWICNKLKMQMLFFCAKHLLSCK